MYNKKYTETLALFLERFRLEQPKFKNSKITYAGRLDPLAEGLMILLTDEDVHRKDKYLNLSKVYEVKFLLGFYTDTYDILGIPSEYQKPSFSKEIFSSALEEIKNLTQQYYPPYSSKTVSGKPLFKWAKEGLLNQIDIPIQNIEVISVEDLGGHTKKAKDVSLEIEKAVKQVTGDFRQKEILKMWRKKIGTSPKELEIHTLVFSVSSGTYIRSLIHELGQKLYTGACCIRIKRLSIEDHLLKGGIQILD